MSREDYHAGWPYLSFERPLSGTPKASNSQSEDPKCGPLDIGPEHGVQAIPRREIYSDRKLLLQKLLDADEFDERELSGWIMVDEQVQITCWLGFVAGRRAENE